MKSLKVEDNVLQCIAGVQRVGMHGDDIPIFQGNGCIVTVPHNCIQNMLTLSLVSESASGCGPK